MADKKNSCVVIVTSNLTSTQASNLLSEVIKAKNKVAPLGRGTAVISTREKLGSYLHNSIKQITN